MIHRIYKGNVKGENSPGHTYAGEMVTRACDKVRCRNTAIVGNLFLKIQMQ